MAVLGFNYTKLHAEKMKPVKGKVSINNNVQVKDVEKQEMNLGGSQQALEISFEYNSNYEPEVAKLEIEGTLLYTDEDEKIEDMMNQWEENNKFDKQEMKEIINYVLGKCNVQAIVMSKDLNIPSPIPLPKVGEDKE